MSDVESKTVAIVQSCVHPVEGLLRPDQLGRRVHPLRRPAVHATRLAEPQPHQDRRRVRRGSRSPSRSRAATSSGSTRRSLRPAWPERHWKTIAHAYAALRTSTVPGWSRARSTTVHGSAAERDQPNVSRGDLRPSRDSNAASLVDRVPGVRRAKTERLVALCRSAGATTYLSGPTARDYIDESLFHDAGIELRTWTTPATPSTSSCTLRSSTRSPSSTSSCTRKRRRGSF